MKTFRQILNEAPIVPNLDFIDKKFEEIRGADIRNDDEAITLLNSVFDNISFLMDYSTDKHDAYVVRGLSHIDGTMSIFVARGIHKVFQGEELWKKFTNVVQETLEHEFVHNVQDQKLRDNVGGLYHYIRNKNIDSTKQPPNDPHEEYSVDDLKHYMKSSHELMAYAREAYREMRNDGMSNEDVRNEINTVRQATYEDTKHKGTRVLNAYRLFMKEPSDRKAFNKFLRYIWSYTQ